MLFILCACAASPEEEARKERKRAEKENSRALVFGASGAAFSPTGSQVAVANRKQIWIADTTTGRVIARLRSTNAAPFGNSKGLEFIDEKRLVIGAQGSILLWDLKEGLVTHQIPLPTRLYMPRAMAWSKVTQTLAFSIGISNATVKVGGVALGAMAYALWPLLVLGAGGNCGVGCGGGADSLYLAITDGYAHASNSLKTSAQPWCGRSNSISPDGKLLADIYPGITKEIIGIYDMESGEKHRELNPRGEYSCVVKFSPNGKQLLITTSKSASLYDTSTWKHFDLDLGKP